MREVVGVSILTNGRRLDSLKCCVGALISHCYYRPLVIGVYDNGSQDDVCGYVDSLKKTDSYGLTWRYERSEQDQGCAEGTNRSIEMVGDCELQLHLESDFELLEEDLSGADKMWMHRAVDFLNSGRCDFLYLRRMRSHREAQMHWWQKWMDKIDLDTGEYLRCPGFWWSNNPSLFRLSSLYDQGILPLDVSRDGPKGTGNWSRPELEAGSPVNAWLHKWGVFLHERKSGEPLKSVGCGEFGPFGQSGCKYGFWYSQGDDFCKKCNLSTGFEDMAIHIERF